MRWPRFFRERPKAGEIDEEIRTHLEMAARDHIERGEAPEEARRVASLEPRNVGVIQEDVRAVWLSVGFERFAGDLRYALRRIRNSPGFTALAVLTLGFGLSVNATIFSLISSMFLRPLPVKDAERLVLVLRRPANSELLAGMSWRDYQDYRAGIPEFDDMLALAYRPAHLSVDGHAPDRTWIEAVSGNYFSMLGVAPSLGRLFPPGEGESENPEPIAVLGYHYWRMRLAADPGVVGRTVVINGQPLTIIGVAPENFSSAQWAMAPSAFVPATLMPELFPDAKSILERRNSGAFKVMARLRAGVGAAQATRSVQAFARRLAEEHGVERENARVFVRPEMLTRPEATFSRFIPFAVGVFALMAVLVLFIACANVANLMFSRAIARRNEIGIRSALGAGRRRLIGQLLTESIVLALLAGGVGMLLSYGSEILLARLSVVAGDVPIQPDERWDWLPLVGTMAVSVLAGLATGLFPALRATRVDPLTVVKGGPLEQRSERHFFRSGLVVSQVAFSAAVLVFGGLFLRSLLELSTHDLGFRTDRLLLASVDLGLQGYDEERGRQFLEQLIERARALPGVESVAIASSVPLDAHMSTRAVAFGDEPAGLSSEAEDGSFRTGLSRVDPGYFDTLGVRLLRGRGIEAQDDAASPRVAVVNETFAARLWANQEAVGKRFRWQSGGDSVQVVGVIGNGKYLMLAEAPRPFVYVPIAQEYSAPATLHVRSRSRDPLALAPAVRETFRSLDPDLPVFNVSTMDEHLRTSAFAYLPLRIAAVVAGAQGLVGLALAVMGVYGVVAFSVSRRTRDIGIRKALGAGGSDVFRLVSASALRPALLGLALGLAASWGLARLIAALLYGLDPMDVPVFAAIAVVMAGVSLLACWLPARRAIYLDPASALRQD